MCFANLRQVTRFSHSAPSVLIAVALMVLPVYSVFADTLIEEVEVPNLPTVQTGVPITDTASVTKRVVDEATSAPPDFAENTSVETYQLGPSAVKEYRDRNFLLFAEIDNAAGTTYVVDYRRRGLSVDQKPRSGISVGNW